MEVIPLQLKTNKTHTQNPKQTKPAKQKNNQPRKNPNIYTQKKQTNKQNTHQKNPKQNQTQKNPQNQPNNPKLKMN